MSALQYATGDKVVDDGHWLEELANKVQPHLSHLVNYAVPQVIINTNDQPTQAICAPLTRTYMMTTKGLAHVTRRLLIFTSKPRLMGHTSIAMIEPKNRVRVALALQLLLSQQIRLYGKY
ncbi:hypothetical protein H7100_03670 [Candidatus Saccharibacteria bacterium]|nr:hypothetical protein [Candidatus Saccharibacteria bacterium]